MFIPIDIWSIELTQMREWISLDTFNNVQCQAGWNNSHNIFTSMWICLFSIRPSHFFFVNDWTYIILWNWKKRRIKKKKKVHPPYSYLYTILVKIWFFTGLLIDFSTHFLILIQIHTSTEKDHLMYLIPTVCSLWHISWFLSVL